MCWSFDEFICTPSRKPIKFNSSSFSRHSLYFDSVLSRHERLVVFAEIFVCASSLQDKTVLSHYVPPQYAPEEYLELRIVSDHLHPAYGQLGLYAKKTIPSNTIVTSYAGFIEVFGASCNSRTYTMGFGNIGDDFALDAEFAGNYGRFANDPRGVVGQCPNLFAENRLNSRGESFTALVTRRLIPEGEEILMDYGKAHSLNSSPWNDLLGRTVLRFRLGGMIPTLSSLNNVRDETFHLFWECPQCGMWSLGRECRNKVESCLRCGSPQVAGCPHVAVLTTGTSQRKDMANETRPYNVLPQAKDDKCAFLENRGKRVEWPMNVPFLPWQVWDPTVPMSTVLKYSRFDSQEHLFLYTVTFSLASDEEKNDESEMVENEINRTNRGKRARVSSMWERRELSGESAPSYTSRGSEEESSTGATVVEMLDGQRELSSFFHYPLSYISLLDTCTQIDRFLAPKTMDKVGVQRVEGALLQMRKRLYTGKEFKPGDLVGYVGGIIRHVSDPRPRPDHSPLAIPLYHFLPWKFELLQTELNSEETPLYRAKLDLLKRFSDLVLIVTNEMMYCPCIACEEKVVGKENAFAVLLESTNVAFTLTVDPLGCPFVACIATSHLNAFEPLLARI